MSEICKCGLTLERSFLCRGVWKLKCPKRRWWNFWKHDIWEQDWYTT